jgi:hypothetical protein
MTATNKRLLISESRGVSNRCTPYRGKLDQHDMYASHVSSRTFDVRFLWAVPVRDNLSYSCQQIWTDSLHPRRKAPDTIHSTRGRSIRGSVPSFSPTTANRAVGKSQASIDNRLLGLPGPYHRHAIDTFNTCSRVSAPRSLTDTGRGYHIENLGIATSLSPPFLFKSSTDPPNGPTGSLFLSNINIQT